MRAFIYHISRTYRIK